MENATWRRNSGPHSVQVFTATVSIGCDNCTAWLKGITSNKANKLAKEESVWIALESGWLVTKGRKLMLCPECRKKLSKVLNVTDKE